MGRTIVWGLLATAVLGCATDGDADADVDTDGSATVTAGSTSSSTTNPPFTTAGTSSTSTGGGAGAAQTQNCADYVACVGEAMADGLSMIEAQYGDEGSCWGVTPAQAAECDLECRVSRNDLVQALEGEGAAVPDVCTGPTTVAYADVVTIIKDACVTGCHEPGGTWDMLDFRGDPRLALVYVSAYQAPIDLVVPSNVEGSYLWHKLVGSQGSVGGQGSRMPEDAPPLSDEQTATIEGWIAGGANSF